MKKINLFARLVLTPLFILFFGFILLNVKDFSKIIVVMSIIAEVVLFLYICNSYSYSNKELQSNFFNIKKIYKLKNITFVRKSNLGYYVFYFGSEYQKENINFLFQKKDRLKLFEYIKTENPTCVFRL